MDKHSKNFILVRLVLYKLLLPSLFIVFTCLLTDVSAQSDVSGKLQNYSAFQTTGEHELVSFRNRLRLGLNKSISSGNFYTEIDFINSYPELTSTNVSVRQAYFDLFSNSYDFRIGKQEIIWGESDGGFVTDILTPVDLSEFLTQEPSDLRIGLIAASVTRYFGNNFLQIVASPTIQKNLLPPSDSRWFPVQTFPENFPDIIPIQFRPSEQDPAIDDVQIASKFSWRPTLDLSLDFMLYHWAHPMPAYAIQIQPPTFINGSVINGPAISLTETYQTSPMAGYSASWQTSDRWVFKSEALFVYERLFTFLPVSVNRLEQALDDPEIAIEVFQEFEIRDDGYLLSKPWYQQMAGVQTDLYGTTMSLQGYVEIILDYEDRILPQKIFPYATFLAQRTFLRDRLQGLVVNRYNFFGKDFWVQTQGIYEVADGLEVALGVNLFGGEPVSPFYGHFTFQQYRENSFLFGRISLFF